MNIALGSPAELDTQLEIALRRGYLRREEAGPALERLARTGRMLHGLQRSLERRVNGSVVVLLTALAWLAGSALLL